MAEQPDGVDLYITHIDLSNAFWSFRLPRKARHIFRFYTHKRGGLRWSAFLLGGHFRHICVTESCDGWWEMQYWMGYF